MNKEQLEFLSDYHESNPDNEDIYEAKLWQELKTKIGQGGGGGNDYHITDFDITAGANQVDVAIRQADGTTATANIPGADANGAGVLTTGAQAIAGTKSFNDGARVSDASITAESSVVNKKYADTTAIGHATLCELSYIGVDSFGNSIFQGVSNTDKINFSWTDTSGGVTAHARFSDLLTSGVIQGNASNFVLTIDAISSVIVSNEFGENICFAIPNAHQTHLYQHTITLQGTSQNSGNNKRIYFQLISKVDQQISTIAQLDMLQNVFDSNILLGKVIETSGSGTVDFVADIDNADVPNNLITIESGQDGLCTFQTLQDVVGELYI